VEEVCGFVTWVKDCAARFEFLAAWAVGVPVVIGPHVLLPAFPEVAVEACQLLGIAILREGLGKGCETLTTVPSGIGVPVGGVETANGRVVVITR
jgi:hypothetical protein